MQTPKILKTAWLLAALSIAGWTTTQAQPQFNANWTGTGGDGLWNDAANWDLGVVPGADVYGTTNATIGNSFIVSYNTPMTASGFGNLTNNGVLAVNTNGFNCSAIVLPRPQVGPIFYLTNGFGAVTVNGDFNEITNAQASMVAGTTLTIGGTLRVESATSSHASGTSTFTNSGGTLSANNTAVANTGGTGTGHLVISGGVNNLGNTSVGRYATGSASTLGTEGLTINGGVVTMTNLTVTAPSYGTVYITSGTVTNIGNVSIFGTTAGRYMRVVQAGGLFVVPDPNLIYEDANTAGTETSRYQVTGGTNIVGGFLLGTTGSAVAATVTVTIGGAVFVGSQGIATNGAVLNTFTLNAGGLLGATAPWIGSIPMNMSGSGVFTIQTADMNGNPNNITNNGVLNGASTCKLNVTGGGTLTMGATNIYTGATLINGGTLTLGASGALASPLIIVGPGTTFDVSAIAGGFSLNNNQTLAGLGSVNGAVIVASGGNISPGSNTITGTLTFNNSLTETNSGAVNNFTLNGAPNPNNDLITIAGDLNASGTNYMNILASLPVPGTNYVLIQYGGNFNGNITNFVVETAIGTLTNDPVAKTISFIPAVSQRGPTNTVWVGNPVDTNWDATISSDTNWLIASSSVLTSFVTGDNVQFTDANASNSPVNIVGTVSPTSILVNSQSNYVIASTSGGWIAGTTGLTVTNTGTLTVLTTNTYTGNTIIDGGSTLAVAQLANAGSPSGIGEGNLIINNGTFAYTGPTVSVNVGATLGNASSAINISANGNLTLGGLTGGGGLTKTGPGTLALGSSGSYSGGTTIAGGVLQLNNASGAGSGTINFNNGTLAYYPSGGIDVGNPFNFAAGTTNMIIVTSGSGGNPVGDGAWTGSGVILVSNTYNPYTVNGVLDGFTGTIKLATTNGSGFRFNSGGGNTCFGSTNATFDLGTNNAALLCRNAGTMNLGALQGGSGTFLQGQDADTGTVVWSIGNNNLSTIFKGTIQDNNSTRLAAVTKIGTGTLTLEGQSTYTGTTTISNGVLALALNPDTSLNGSIDSSAIINVTPGVFLDVSGRSDQTLQLGASATQQLRGRGTINGSLNVGGTGTVAPGGGPGGNTGTLTVTNTITLGGTAWMKLNRANTPNSDQLVSSIAQTVNLGGTLLVTNIGAALQVGDTFTLFGGTTFNGSSFTTLELPSAYSWDTSQLNVNGSITVTGILTPPSFSTINFNQLAGTFAVNAFYPDATNYYTEYYLANVLTTTNLALPLSSWTLATNAYFDNTGHLLDYNNGNPVIFYVNLTNPPTFYQLQVFPANP